MQYTSTNATFDGMDTFTYIVEDAAGAQSTGIVEVTITGDQAPVTVNDTVSVAGGNSIFIDPLANDTDPEGSSLSLVSVTGALAGTVALVRIVPTSLQNEYDSQSQYGYYNSIDDYVQSYYGSWDYYYANYYSGDPSLINKFEVLYTSTDPNFHGDEILTYVVEDAAGIQSTGTITVNVVANQSPVAVADSYAVDPGESVVLTLIANDSDPEGDAIQISSVANPVNGTVTLIPDVSTSIWDNWTNNGQYSYSVFEDWYNSYYNYSGNNPLSYQYEYTPNAGFSGDDVFSYAIEDVQGATASASVTVSVAGNQAPLAVDDNYLTGPGEAIVLNLLANDSDIEGHEISIDSIADPANGTLALVPIVSESIWNYWLSQGQNYYSNFEDWYSSYYNYSGTNPLTYQYEYTPDAGFGGDDTFSYTVIDSQGATATASVTVSVTSNQAPVAGDDTYSTGAGEAVVLDLLANDSDPDGHTISVQSIADPAGGSVTLVPDVTSSTWNSWLSNGQNYFWNFEEWYNSYYNYSGTNPLAYQYEYTPDAGFSGDDVFSYTLVDSQGATTIASITVSVAPNLLPIAQNDTLIVQAHESASFEPLANDSDPEGSALTLISVSAATLGTASVIRFVSSTLQSEYENYGGYTSVDDYILGYYGGWEAYFQGYGNPADDRFVIRYERTNPTVAGTESITYTVRDEQGGESVGTIDVVLLGDEPPAFDAAPYQFTLAENVTSGTIVGQVTATDPDVNQTLVYSITAGNELGSFDIDSVTGQITVVDGSLLDYEENPQFTLTVQVENIYQVSSTTQVVIDLTDEHDPIALPDAVFTLSELALAGVSVGQVGVPQPNAGVTYTYQILPGVDATFFSIDQVTGEITVNTGASFDYETVAAHALEIQVDSSDSETATAVVTINLMDENEAPVAVDTEVAVRSGQPLVIELQGSLTDPEGDTLELISWSSPTPGIVFQPYGNNHPLRLTYISATGSLGEDQFTYTVRDSSGNETTGTVFISSTLVQSLELAFGTETEEGWTATNPLLSGVVAGMETAGTVLLEFDHDGDGIAEATQTVEVIDALDLIPFNYKPEGITAGPQTIHVRSVVIDPVTGENLTPGWIAFSFELLEYVAPNVIEFSLGAGWSDPDSTGGENETPVDSESVPANRLMGRLNGPATEIAFVQVEFDHDGDDQIDGTAWTDSLGRFVYDPASLDGSQVTIRARSLVEDPLTGDPVNGSWNEVTFQSSATPIAGISTVQLAYDLGENEANWSTYLPEITGQLDGSYQGELLFGLIPEGSQSESSSYNEDAADIAGVVVEFDHDGDDLIDGRATSDENGKFRYTAAGLSAGLVSLRMRTSIWDDQAGQFVTGMWSTVFFQLEARTLLTPVISDFGLADDNGTDTTDLETSNPLLRGEFDAGEQAAGISLEFSHVATGETVDGTAQVSASGTFQYLPVGIALGAQTTRVRTVQWNPETRQAVRGDWVSLEWTWVEEAAYVPTLVPETTPADPPEGGSSGEGSSLPPDHVAGDDTAAGTYNGIITTASTTRDSIIDGANNTYSTNVAQALSDYEAVLAASSTTFQSEIGSFSGITTTFNRNQFAPIAPPPKITQPPAPTLTTPLANSSYSRSGSNANSSSSGVMTGSTNAPGVENDPAFKQAVAQAQATLGSNSQNAQQQYEDALKQLVNTYLQAVNSSARSVAQQSAAAQAALATAIKAAENPSSVNSGNSNGQQQTNGQIAALQAQVNSLLDQLENLQIDEYLSENTPAYATLQQAFIDAWNQKESDIADLDSQQYTEEEYDLYIDGMIQIEQDFNDALKAAELAYRQANNDLSYQNTAAYYSSREPLLTQLSELRMEMEKAQNAAAEASAKASAEFQHRKQTAIARAETQHAETMANLSKQQAEGIANAVAAFKSGAASAHAANQISMAGFQVAFASAYNSALESAVNAWASANPGPESQYQLDLFAAEKSYVDDLNSNYQSRVSDSANALASAIAIVAEADKTEAIDNASAAADLSTASAQAEETKTTAIADANKALADTQATEAKTKNDALAEALNAMNQSMIQASHTSARDHQSAYRDHANDIAQIDHDILTVPTIYFYAVLPNGSVITHNETGAAYSQMQGADYLAALQTAQESLDDAQAAASAQYHVSRIAAQSAWSSATDSAYRAEQDAITAESVTNQQTIIDAEFAYEQTIQAAQETHDSAVAQNGKTAYQIGWDEGIALQRDEIDAAKQAAIDQADAAGQKSEAIANAADAYRQNVAQAQLNQINSWSAAVDSAWSRYQATVAQARFTRSTATSNNVSAVATASLTRATNTAQKQADYAHARLDAAIAQQTAVNNAQDQLQAQKKTHLTQFKSQANTAQKTQLDQTLQQRSTLQQSLISASSTLRTTVDSTHYQSQGTVEYDDEGRPIRVVPNTGFDAAGAQDQSELSFTEDVSRAQESNAHSQQNLRLAYQNEVSNLTRTWATDVSNATSTFVTESTSARNAYAETVSGHQETLSNGTRADSNQYYETTRSIRMAEENANQTADQVAQDAIRLAYQTYQEELATEKADQLADWVATLTTSGEIAPEVGAYHAAIADADLAYTTAVNSAQATYDQIVQAAAQALRTNSQAAEQTAYEALQTEWETVDAAWSSWEAETQELTRKAENKYQQQITQADRDRWLQDLNAQTSTEDSLRQSRTTYDNATTTHYANWINNIADDQVSYLRSGGYNGWTQDQAFDDHVAVLQTDQNNRNDAISGSLTSLVSGVGDTLVSNATALGGNALTHANAINSAEATYHADLSALPPRPNDLLTTQAQNEAVIYGTQDATIRALEEVYRLAVQNARATYEGAIQDATALKVTATTQALVDYQIVVAQNESTAAAAQATVSGTAEDQQAAYEAAAQLAYMQAYATSYVTYQTAQTVADNNYEGAINTADNGYADDIAAAEAIRQAQLDTAWNIYSMATLESDLTYQTDYDTTQQVFRTNSSLAQQTQRTNTFEASRDLAVNQATAQRDYQNGQRPDAATPSTSTGYNSLLTQESDTYDQAVNGSRLAYQGSTVDSQQGYHTGLSQASRDDQARYLEAERLYDIAVADANLAFEQARIAAQTTRRGLIAAADADYAYEIAQADAAHISGERAANVAAWSSLSTDLGTPYAQFKLDEAQAQADTWDAIKTQYIAQYNPAGSDNFATANLSSSSSRDQAWTTYALAQATINHQQEVDRLNLKAGFDLGITDAEHQQTTKLAEVQQQFQQAKYEIAGYSQSDYDYAGLAVETYVDENGNTVTNEPSRDTVYRNSVKQAWRDSDQAQSTARLDYVTDLSTLHQTAEADLAEVNRIYQQALADANRIASDTRALVRTNFNKLEADTYAQETAAWTTSAPTPWHKQAAQNAEAQADYIEIEQTQLLAKKQAENAAERDYAVERETAWKTLRTDRSAQQASDAITQQQLLENGGYEYEPGDYDPYENVTVDLPTGVNYSDTGDPTKFENDLDDGNFNGNLNLGNTFGSGIGNANYEEGSSEDAFSPYDLASQQAGQQRGQSFNANNPLGNLGTSSAQINGVQNVNWTGNLSDQQTNQLDAGQIGSSEFGTSPAWQKTSPTEQAESTASNESDMPVSSESTPNRNFTGPQLPPNPNDSPQAELNRYAEFNSLFQEYQRLTGQDNGPYPFDQFSAWSTEDQIAAIENGKKLLNDLKHPPKPNPTIRPMTPEEKAQYQDELDWENRWRDEDLTDPGVAATYQYELLKRKGMYTTAFFNGAFFVIDNVGMGFTGLPGRVLTPRSQTLPKHPSAHGFPVNPRNTATAGFEHIPKSYGGKNFVIESTGSGRTAIDILAGSQTSLNRKNRPATVAILDTQTGRTYQGQSTSGSSLHPVVDTLVKKYPSDFGNQCAELDTISQALWDYTFRTGIDVTSVEQARQILTGSTIQTARVRNPEHPQHGTPIAPCAASCESILLDLGITYQD
ncbi:tandem-95 repeat protein [uncultured Rubinisphaera sp.]|uniref:Ig-like domain-containing protein n=1 Tax=uncultured Rubinisphaera sp. TaxID=1678686 RepID=UPI0030D97C37